MRVGEDSWRALEMDSILRRISSRARSELGKAFVEGLRPCDDLRELERRRALLEDLLSLCDSVGDVPWSEVGSVVRLLEDAKVTGYLRGEELLAFRRTMELSQKVKSYLKDNRPLAPRLWSMASRVKDFEFPLRELSVLDEHGALYDWASPRLSELRRLERSVRDRIKAYLNSFVSDPEHGRMLQERSFFLRNGRFVVPVKGIYVNKFPGMLQEWSGSGATAYMEPAKVVSMNNELSKVLAEIGEEELKILRALTQMLLGMEGDLIYAEEFLSMVDGLYAVYRYSAAEGAKLPALSAKSAFSLRRFRHPLLGERAVPIDVCCGEGFRILVITGPNTGGKTVALKSVGVAVTMAWCGLPLPASSDSVVGVFDELFIDVGDEQSIQQNLSTFSSHVSKIIRMLERATSSSLVLLDELGAGTDPQEGAALGVAILEEFRRRGTLVVATTHHELIKIYSLSQEGVESASVEFDLETLSPTYRIVMGIPGRSNALDIALMLGMPRSVVEEARSRLGTSRRDLEEVVAELHAKREALDKALSEAERRRAEAEEMAARLRKEMAEVESRRLEVIRRAEEEAAKVIREVQEQAKAMLSSIRGQARSEADRAYQKGKEAMEEGLARLASLKGEAAVARGLLPSPGDLVRVEGSGLRGKLVEVKRGMGRVEVGGATLEVPLASLVKDEAREEELRGAGYRLPKPKEVPSSISVRGKTVEEALPEVMDYLDRAYRFGYPWVSIVHGRGEGILRREIHKMLRDVPYVASFELASPAEGGEGVTVVRFVRSGGSAA